MGRQHPSSIRRAVLSAALVLAGALTTLAAPPAAQAAAAVQTSVTLDGGKPGLTFDGVGAISGGGGNSRLLVDYPEPQRTQLLDYLFKPGYGASLQVLKLEIGGDTNSTDGAEPSIEHTRGTVDCNQGYEWWLAEQAKARNPDITFYGLSWGAPGWIGDTGSGGNFWSQDSVDYVMSWMDCAARHQLNVSHLGGWNERGYDKGWYENLKSTLVARGYGATKVVAADDTSGAAVQLWACDGSAQQVWTRTNGTLTHNGKCLDVIGGGTVNGTKVELWDCHGGANQQWTPQPDGSLRSDQSGRCLDDPAAATADGTPLEIWDCNGGANQRWTLP
ncbi:ricin-type beta-trefoil lectin domain protein [Kitasatospora sp. NPDC005856]|uniref:ricin-type beta-trefoil lectin domain protein n=1 Tax=Kitasatospora sp. NPDC005856 TaxID=3154566 RepID=UPI0033F86287